MFGRFLVENIDCRQTNVGDFLLSRNNFVPNCGVYTGMSTAGAPDALLASDKDKPAAPTLAPPSSGLAYSPGPDQLIVCVMQSWVGTLGK